MIGRVCRSLRAIRDGSKLRVGDLNGGGIPPKSIALGHLAHDLAVARFVEQERCPLA